MATTSRGYPLFAGSDSAEIAQKLNAMMNAVNGDVGAVTAPPGVAVPATSSFTSTVSVLNFGPLTALYGVFTKKTGTITGTIQLGSLPSAAYYAPSVVRASCYGYATGAPSAAEVMLEIASGSSAINATYLGQGDISSVYLNGLVYVHS